MAIIRQRLSSCAEEEQIELLTLLLGRILQIQEADEKSITTVQEIAQIVQVAMPFAHKRGDAQGVVVEMLGSLPMRTEQEVAYVLDLAHNTPDEKVQKALLVALRYSQPESDAARDMLARARNSGIAAIRKAVGERLRQST